MAEAKALTISLFLYLWLSYKNVSFPDFITFLRHHIAQIENQ